MKNARVISTDVGTRVENAVHNAMDLYMNKLATGFYDVGLENAFQMHLADLIGRELEQNTFADDERFTVQFEKNIPINGNNDYIDVVIEYTKGTEKKKYLIELKFKKVSDSAPNLGNIESYKDIYNLDCHKQKTPGVAGCYFIFLTNYDAYLTPSATGTRTEIPMYDGYTILADRRYTVTGSAAVKATEKYPDGFIFSEEHPIEYQHIHLPECNTDEKDYYFFILKI